MAKIVTPVFRCSYLHVFEPHLDPNDNLKYSVSMLFPKDSTDMGPIKEAIKEATVDRWGNDKKKWPKGLKTPLKDGDDRDDENYAGHWYINASANENRKPGIVDAKLDPILDPMSFYSGCYARASVNFYAYDNVSKGVGCGLNNIMMVKEGEPFGTPNVKPEEDFAEFASSVSSSSDDDSNDLGF